MEQAYFYRSYAESAAGDEGSCFYEVRGNVVTRQIWKSGKSLFWASPTGCKNEAHGFTDQPEWNDGAGAIDLVECRVEAFSQAWIDSGGPR